MSSASRPAPRAASHPRARWSERLHAPIDSSSLVFFRIAFGLLVFWEVAAFVRLGWVDAYFVAPRFHFSYLGFGWVRPLPGAGMHALFFALAALALAFAAGVFHRVSATLLCVGLSYMFLVEQAVYLNHLYLVCLISFLMIFVPAQHELSFDVWRRPELRRRRAPVWTLELLRFQMGIVYLFAGIAKLNADWLAGWPLRMWLPVRADLPLVGGLLDEAWLAVLFSWGGAGLDLLAWPLLVWRRSRPWVFGVLLTFHVTNALIFDIGIFPWLSLAGTAMFFDAGWPRRLLLRAGLASDAASAGLGAPAASSSLRRQATLSLLGVYVVLQLLLPLRHLLYPGDPSWTEQGHHFAWRQKLRQKQASLTWQITDARSGQTYEVQDLGFLNWRQREKMTTRPDMLLQFGHFLAHEYERQIGGAVEVRARVLASLNGREPQLLIDPNVDLARQPRNLWPRSWILPLRAERN